jgi:hypothetical protein
MSRKRPPKKSSSVKTEAQVAAEAMPPPAGSTQGSVDDAPERDDLSVPPMGDLDAAFFDSPFAGNDDMEDGELSTEDPALALKRSPRIALRRARLARYVKGAVAVSSMLCVAAFVKAAVTRGHGGGEGTHVAQASQPALVEREVKAPEPTITTATATATPTPTPTAPATTAPATTAPATTITTAPATATAPAPAPTPAPTPTPASASHAPEAGDTAARETAIAQSALERGRVGAAIEAGERAVALDPADGNAWLLLGAAYQQKGDMKDARRCYKACVDQASRGPRRECAAMLR